MAKGLFGGGDGSVASPYLVEDAMDLHAIRFYPTMSFKLTRNINLDVPPFSVMGWQPIPVFSGRIDGNGMKIINMRINKPTSNYVGFISKVNWACASYTAANHTKIWNLSIENAKVTGNNYVGILVGHATTNYNLTVSTTDDSLAWADKIHVSGEVTGSDNVGGLIGYYQYTIGGNYAYKPIQDIQVNVLLKPQAVETQCALLIGYFNTSINSILTIADCVLRGSYSFAGGNIAGANSVMNKSTTYLNTTAAFNISTCVYNNEIWNGQATFNSIGKSATQMIKKEEFENLELKKTADGKNVWTFSEGRAPRLSFLEKNCFFIEKAGSYYTYDVGTQTWIEQFSGGYVPTLDEALAVGMSTLDIIDKVGKEWLEANLGIINVIDFVDKSVGVALAELAVASVHTTEKDTASKQTYSTTIAFADYGQGIDGIEGK